MPARHDPASAPPPAGGAPRRVGTAGHFLGIPRAELVPALAASWLLLSLFGATAVLAPLVLPARVVLSALPACSSVARGHGPCPACGLTRGFVHVARGELGAASRSHRWALPLYFALSANSVVASAFAIRRLRGPKRAEAWAGERAARPPGGLP